MVTLFEGPHEERIGVALPDEKIQGGRLLPAGTRFQGGQQEKRQREMFHCFTVLKHSVIRTNRPGNDSALVPFQLFGAVYFGSRSTDFQVAAECHVLAY